MELHTEIPQKIIWNFIKNYGYARLLIPAKVTERSFIRNVKEVSSQYEITTDKVVITLTKLRKG